MNRRLMRVIVLVAFVVFVYIYFSDDENVVWRAQEMFTSELSSQEITSSADAHGRVLYQVTKVVDGDTIEISKDGKRMKVRLIGIDTPETVDPRRAAQCFGHEASEKAHELLDGAMVAVEIGPSQDTYDKYRRLLAYVFLSDGTFVNEYMIANGYAHEYTYDLPYKYQSDFKKAEQSAREGSKGLWAQDTCAGDTTRSASREASSVMMYLWHFSQEKAMVGRRSFLTVRKVYEYQNHRRYLNVWVNWMS